MQRIKLVYILWAKNVVNHLGNVTNESFYASHKSIEFSFPQDAPLVFMKDASRCLSVGGVCTKKVDCSREFLAKDKGEGLCGSRSDLVCCHSSKWL